MSIFGSIKRLLVGGKGKTSSTSNSTTTQDPYAPAVPQLQSYIDSLGPLYDNTPQFSDYELSALDNLQSAAQDRSALNPAIAANNQTLSGAYLTPDTNPYLADIAKRVGGKAMSAINATFGGQGRTGSGLHQNAAGEGVGAAISNLYGGAYENERNRMTQAAGLAPQLTVAGLAGPQAMVTAGQNVSARPYDIAAQRGNIMNTIANFGRTVTGNSTSSGTSQAESGGILGKMIDKLFK